MLTLWAVHISDGVLHWSWQAGGFAIAGLLAWLGSRRLREEEIPRIAVMSSAFFVACLIHVPVPLPFGVRAHLLFNGLVGIVLGPRAALAIPLALFLQALLLAHGGIAVLGVNTCAMVFPALLAWLAFAGLRRIRWESSSRFWGAAGLVIGGLAVLITAALNCLVLWHGGTEELPALAQIVFLAHLPIAGVEALIMSATVSFLVRVKPEMLGLQTTLRAETSTEERVAGRQAG